MFRQLDGVTLVRDFPQHGLRRGDDGTVERYTLTLARSKFIAANGKTIAVVIIWPGLLQKTSVA
jgi:hypothetical protein